MQKKREQQKSLKQQSEFEGKDKHIWHQRLKKLTELRFKEIEEEALDNQEDSGFRRREHNQS